MTLDTSFSEVLPRNTAIPIRYQYLWISFFSSYKTKYRNGYLLEIASRQQHWSGHYFAFAFV